MKVKEQKSNPPDHVVNILDMFHVAKLILLSPRPAPHVWNVHRLDNLTASDAGAKTESWVYKIVSTFICILRQFRRENLLTSSIYLLRSSVEVF